MIHEAHFRSCLNLKETLTGIGLAHDTLTGRNESLVHRARMEMTASFLKTDHTHLMWLDADIEFTPDDVAKVWNLDADIGVAFYSMKRSDQPLSAWKDGKLVRIEDCPAEPFEVQFAGTGFMLIKRTAIEKIVAFVQEKERRAVELLSSISCVDDFDRSLVAEMSAAMAASYEGPHGRVDALYTAHIFNDGLESEDYHFCRIAREAGLRIIGDPSIKLGHWGGFRYGASA